MTRVAAAGDAPAAVGTGVHRVVAALRARAGRVRRRIVLPESADPRTLAAARVMAETRMADPVLVLDGEHPATHDGVRATAAALGIALIDPDGADPLDVAMNLVRSGGAAACVAGAAHTTAAVVRAALRTLGRGPGVRTVSSAFYMVLASPFGTGGSEVLTFTDCAVVPEPTADQLADIAIAAARDRARVVGDVPRVAFLSFSTWGSGGDAAASLGCVREALALARDRAPDVLMDGELQVDAALVPAVAARKGSVSAVAGSANVLVFPSLDAGNIAYKLVERLAGAVAIGPILQGLAHPCADLSRGAGPDDIINAAAVTALQAGAAA